MPHARQDECLALWLACGQYMFQHGGLGRHVMFAPDQQHRRSALIERIAQSAGQRDGATAKTRALARHGIDYLYWGGEVGTDIRVLIPLNSGR